VIAVFLAWETLFHGEDDSAAVPEPTDGGAWRPIRDAHEKAGPQCGPAL